MGDPVQFTTPQEAVIKECGMAIGELQIRQYIWHMVKWDFELVSWKHDAGQFFISINLIQGKQKGDRPK